MNFSKAVHFLLIHFILLHCSHHLTLAYTKVATSGSSSSGDEGPRIYKAVNFDLIFPKSFNASENVISTTPASASIPTPSESAAIVGQHYNPMPQSNEPTNTAAAIVNNQEQPLYVTPWPSNEAGSYDNNRQPNTNSNNNNAAQMVTQNPINFQQQQPRQQQNDNNKALNEQQQQQQQNLATGRAVDYHTGYPFGQLITPLIKNAPSPVYKKPVASTTYSNVGKIIYPQAVQQQRPSSQAEIDKLRGKGSFKDRFAPSEGVASHHFKSNNHNHHNHAPTYTAAGKIPSASNVVNSYIPPTNLYSFPPNNVNYPTQSQGNKLALPSGMINSYAPPPSGSLKNRNYNLATASTNDNPYQYPGPLNNGYVPAASDDSGGGPNDTKDNGGGGDGDLDNGGADDSVGVLPASAMDGDNDNGGDNNADMGDNNGDMGAPMNSHDDMSNDHSYDTAKEYPTPPPGWLDDHPHHDHHPDSTNIELDHDHHHHHPDIELDHNHDHHHDPHSSHSFDFHDHDSYPSYPSFPIYHHSYPEIIYDDHHDHHDHHIEHVEPPPPTTTEAPLPEPAPEPRVKKYSYFYIGRKLWYIPLYFTVWFSFYVLWLILKSIARHKVNLPNHYVARRSVDNYDFSKNQQETINQLTVAVMNNIENFKRKYLN